MRETWQKGDIWQKKGDVWGKPNRKKDISDFWQKEGDFYGKTDREEISERNLTERKFLRETWWKGDFWQKEGDFWRKSDRKKEIYDRKKEISQGNLTNFGGKSDRKKKISEGNQTERRRFLTHRRSSILIERRLLMERFLTESRFLRKICQKEGEFWQ